MATTGIPTLRALVRRSAAVAEPVAVTEPHPRADRGAPLTGLDELYEQAAPAVSVGVWSCTPGSWPIENRPDTEAVVVVSGRARIEDADGQSREVGPGDVVVLPRGWSGRWEILETLQKVYVLIGP